MTDFVFFARLLDLETYPATHSQCIAQESNANCEFSPLIEVWVKRASWRSRVSQSCSGAVFKYAKRALLTSNSTMAVLDDLLSNPESLGPFDRSLEHDFEAGVQIQYSSIDTIELMPEESADHILNSIIMQDSEG